MERGKLSEMPRALTYDRYGRSDVLIIRTIDLPDPRHDQVRVRVRAAALNPKDVLVRNGKFALLSGRKFPKRIGVDFSGEVVQAGAGLEAGARIWGVLEEVRYLRGSVADELICNRNECGLMPDELSFQEAAALPLVSLTALQALRDLAGLRAGDRIALHGASGGVGTVAIQLAKALGAHVTTTSSAHNLEWCRSVGADVAFNYAADNLLAESYRVIFDIYGNLSFKRVKHALVDGGVFVSTVPSARIVFDAMRTIGAKKRAKLVVIRSRREHLDTIAAMVARKQLRPVIDCIEPLARYREAFAHLETKHARGKVVIAI